MNILIYFILLMKEQNMRKAFTLAELLITLGIIGIVSALTIPNLLYQIKGKIIQGQLKQCHAILNQAYRQAVAENGDISTWDITAQRDTGDSANKLYEYFKNQLKIGEDCGIKSGCFYSGTYKGLFASHIDWHPRTWGRYARVRLITGQSFAFWSCGGACSTPVDNNTGFGIIYVDINGNSGPNQAGIDYFRFDITKTGIVPASISGNSTSNENCRYKFTSNQNGALCTKWVIKKGNIDYTKRDISAELDNL
jgi:prepilin-type N-terminal cleavage/methylation domain-containing protein